MAAKKTAGKAVKADETKATSPAEVEGQPDEGTGASGFTPNPNQVLAENPDSAEARNKVIAARSQDVDKAAVGEHFKVFVVQRNADGDDYDDDMHARNIDAMRQAMLLQGLRPTEDGHFVGAEQHPDGQSVCLTYACACVPAAVATQEESVVFVTVADQHAGEHGHTEGNKPVDNKGNVAELGLTATAEAEVVRGGRRAE